MDESCIHTPINGDEFLEVVTPALEACDPAALAKALLIRWRARDVCKLLKHPNVDVRRVAAVALGMIGHKHTMACLTHALRDADGQVNQMAEHALWSIWFRMGSPEATGPFREGLAHLAADNYAQAVAAFRRAAEIDPQFAEAWNQLAIAYYFEGDYRQSVEACVRAIKLIPTHFGAIAGLGHSLAQLGDLNLALRCYRRAKRINPRMEGVQDTIARLETKITDMSDSGYFEVDHILS